MLYSEPIRERLVEPLVVSAERHFAAKQLGNGRVLASDLAARGDPVEGEPRWRAHVRDTIRALLPQLEFVSFPVSPGTYDVTPDHQAILGAVPGTDGVWIAAGSPATASSMSPVVGSSIAAAVAGEPPTTTCAARSNGSMRRVDPRARDGQPSRAREGEQLDHPRPGGKGEGEGGREGGKEREREGRGREGGGGGRGRGKKREEGRGGEGGGGGGEGGGRKGEGGGGGTGRSPVQHGIDLDLDEDAFGDEAGHEQRRVHGRDLPNRARCASAAPCQSQPAARKIRVRAVADRAAEVLDRGEGDPEGVEAFSVDVAARLRRGPAGRDPRARADGARVAGEALGAASGPEDPRSGLIPVPLGEELLA